MTSEVLDKLQEGFALEVLKEALLGDSRLINVGGGVRPSGVGVGLGRSDSRSRWLDR